MQRYYWKADNGVPTPNMRQLFLVDRESPDPEDNVILELIQIENTGWKFWSGCDEKLLLMNIYALIGLGEADPEELACFWEQRYYPGNPGIRERILYNERGEVLAEYTNADAFIVLGDKIPLDTEAADYECRDWLVTVHHVDKERIKLFFYIHCGVPYVEKITVNQIEIQAQQFIVLGEPDIDWDKISIGDPAIKSDDEIVIHGAPLVQRTEGSVSFDQSASRLVFPVDEDVIDELDWWKNPDAPTPISYYL